MLPRIFHKKFALGDARSAERICLDDVRPGFQKSAMNVANHFWLSQCEQVTIIQKAFPGVLEPFAPNIGLSHAVCADRRTHRSINDGDTIFENLFDGMTSGLHVFIFKDEFECASIRRSKAAFTHKRRPSR